MKFYLSSFKLGNETAKLKNLLSGTTRLIGYIPNALDFSDADPLRKTENIDKDMQELKEIGTDVELLDLKNYFGKEAELNSKLSQLGGIYVSGGNTFVLRQAYKLSGLDNILINEKMNTSFLYIAYSAGVCVLAETLKYYAFTDNANDFPYPQIKEQIWEGLGMLDFIFEPHYASDHPESASTDKEIKKLIENKVFFKAYRDGEVLIIE